MRERRTSRADTPPRSPNISSQQSQHNNTTTEQISHHHLLPATSHSCFRSSHTFISRPCSAWTTEGFSHSLSQESSFIPPGQPHQSTGYEDNKGLAPFRRGLLHISLEASDTRRRLPTPLVAAVVILPSPTGFQRGQGLVFF